MNARTLPFEDSRRLTGPNLYFASTGAVLEVAGIQPDETLIAQWQARVERARARLGWTDRGVVARPHQGGASLALAAPCDQLFVATEVNEWALCASVYERDPQTWSRLEQDLVAVTLEETPDTLGAPVLEEQAALARFERLAAAQAQPRLIALITEATTRGLAHLADETTLTLGAGDGGSDFSVADLPDVSAVPWQRLHNIPTAAVTGSNGKTTTVRLLAACARAQGWRTAYSSTDGVVVDGEVAASGDYSGPVGARTVMREHRAQAAILETARGGILRRGIAVSRVDVAVVTNVSPDHFGEYGIFDLDALAEVKLVVARIVAPEGLLALNADDTRLLAKASDLANRFGHFPPLGWFALEAEHPALREHRERGGSTCGVRNGRLVAAHHGVEHDLGDIAEMPLTVGATVPYNIANIAGAGLAALALGVDPATIAAVFSRFGASSRDNVGRMMQFNVGGVRVLLDYAHNAEGLRGLLGVAERLRAGKGRLGLILGHAGNRQDAEIEDLARVAAGFSPSLVVVKENESHLRGRAPGEVPRIIRAALLQAGLPELAVPMRMSEVEAAQCALEWAQPGDVLALPVHSSAARAEVLAILESGGQQSS